MYGLGFFTNIFMFGAQTTWFLKRIPEICVCIFEYIHIEYEFIQRCTDLWWNFVKSYHGMISSVGWILVWNRAISSEPQSAIRDTA